MLNFRLPFRCARVRGAHRKCVVLFEALELAKRSVHARVCAGVSLMNVMSILKVYLLFLSFSIFKNTAFILFVLKVKVYFVLFYF